MRVPVLQQQRVESSQLPSQAPYLRNPDTSLAELANGVGRGLTGLARQADNAQTAASKARQEALSLQEADKLLEQQERAQRRLKGDSKTKSEGFLTLRGLRASEASADVVDGLEKDREEIARGISDPLAKQRFLVKSREQLLAFRGQVETHTSKEFQGARDATLKARMGQAVGMAEAGVTDFDAWLAVSRQVEGEIDGLAPSAEAAEAVKVAFRADNAFALTRGLVAQGRIEDAVAYVRENRGALGKNFPEASALVDRANAGAEKDRIAGEVSKLVDTSAEAVRTPDGYVTEEDLRKAVPVEGYEGSQRDQVEAELRQRVQLERDRFKADNNKHRDNVNRSDLPGNPRAGDSELWLEKYDPDFLLARQARKQAQYERWLARQNGTPAQRSAAAKQQADDDEAFRYRLKRRLTEDPNVNPADVEVEFIADMKKKYGRDVAISQPELERGGAMSADAQKRATSKDSAADKANGARVEKAVVAAIKRGLAKGEKVDPTALNDEVGRDLLRLEAKIEANGGKPLTEAQWSDFEEEITRELTIEKPGRIYGTNTVPIGRAGQQPVYGPPAPPPKLTATPKQVKSYVVSPDKKQRRPRYSDGTLGPLEQVP